MSSQVEELTIILKAEYAGCYKIRLHFNDNTERVVDFEAFLKRSRNPMTTKYLDPSEFQKFSITDGDLEWNHYEMCFPVADLHEGNV